MFDIVIPENNEAELLAMAHRLGYKQVLLLYKKHTVAPKTELPIKVLTGLIVTKPTQHYSNVITVAKSSLADRAFLEHNPSAIMYDFELVEQPDTMHQRTSGLNQVLCKLAAGKTSIYFSFTSILNAQGMQSPKLLGRIMQNIILCRKYKIHMGIASFASNPYDLRSSYDIKSFFTLLGMQPNELNNAFSLPDIQL